MKLIIENWKRFLIKENEQVEMAKTILSKVDTSHPDVKDDISDLLIMLNSGKIDDSVSGAIKHYSKEIELSPEEQKFVDSLPEPKPSPMGSILDNPDILGALSNIQNKSKGLE
jgi:hypothetical protein